MPSPSRESASDIVISGFDHDGGTTFRRSKFKTLLPRLINRTMKGFMKICKSRNISGVCSSLWVPAIQLVLRPFRGPLTINAFDIKLSIMFSLCTVFYAGLAGFLYRNRSPSKSEDDAAIICSSVFAILFFFVHVSRVWFTSRCYPSYYKIRLFLQHIVTISPIECRQHIERVRSGRPWLGWQIECGYDAQSGDAPMAKVVTSTFHEEFQFSSCEDVRDPVELAGLEQDKLTWIDFSTEFVLADAHTEKAFKEKQEQFVEAHRRRERQYELKTILSLPEFRKIVVVSPSRKRPLLFHWWCYVVATWLMLDLPYLYLLNMCWSRIVAFKYVKRFQI
ncbi:uncharacterized protein LOC129599246 [Paramacrobiotus metropolitanus]|uniref:uncharacterized protein LOC129599246 n=1 Tax=Paramacrobiotus metropolitanus TaxID=2943436 RepID=UPI00244603E2|nr:uncharacterized protein LOC129599246 [Paramacrobiotus metropolitanus]